MSRDDLAVKQEFDACYESVQLEEYSVKINKTKRRKTGRKPSPPFYTCKTGKCKDKEQTFQKKKDLEEHSLGVDDFYNSK